MSTARSSASWSIFSRNSAIERCAASRKPSSTSLDLLVGDAVLAHLRQPLVVVQHAVAQPRAEHVLQVAETLVAEAPARSAPASTAGRRRWRRCWRPCRRRSRRDCRAHRPPPAPAASAVLGALRDHRPQRLEVASARRSFTVMTGSIRRFPFSASALEARNRTKIPPGYCECTFYSILRGARRFSTAERRQLASR